ncbi:MAG: hypothetical protein AAGG08_04730 [Actinomycetota bacterium]
MLRELWNEPQLTPASAATGSWVLDALERLLGNSWPSDFWERNGYVPEFLAQSPGHVVALQELVEFGLHADEVSALRGFAQIRNALQKDLTVGQLLHGRLQMEVAALAAARGHRSSFEVRLGEASPIDVVLDVGDERLAVETFTVLADEQFRDGQQYSERIRDAVSRLRLRHDVEVDGSLDERLNDHKTDRWLDELDRAALATRTSGDEQVVRTGSSKVVIRPRTVGAGAGFTGPPIPSRGWERTASRLRGKATRAANAGAGWLRVDLRDGLWGLTPWSQSPFAERVIELAELLVETIGAIPLDGVVVSSGAVQASSSTIGISCRPPFGGFGMRRLVGRFRARETVIVPLSPRGFAQAPIWQQLYEAEPGWIDAALTSRKLPPLREILAPRQPPGAPKPVQPGERPEISGPLWPATLHVPTAPPKLVYLDLNHWIALAKAHAGHPTGDRYIEVLEALLKAATEGRARFPIADSIVVEISNIGQHRQRKDLREIIEALSRFFVVTARDVISTHEVEAMLDLHVGVSSRPIAEMDYLDWGLARAFGIVGGFRVRDEQTGADRTAETRAQHPSGPETFDRILAEAEWDLQRSVLDGPTPEQEPELRALGWRPHPTSETTQRRLQQEIDQTQVFNSWPNSRQQYLHDAVSARELMIELNATLSEGLHDRGVSLSSVFTDPEMTRSAVKAMPSFLVAVTLKAAYHRNPEHKWKRNDIHDIDALGSTVPYCDVVVTDKAAATHVRSAGLPERFNTHVLHRLDDLVALV